MILTLFLKVLKYIGKHMKNCNLGLRGTNLMGELEGAKFLYLKCTMFFQKYYTIKNMKSITHFKNYKFKEQKKYTKLSTIPISGSISYGQVLCSLLFLAFQLSTIIAIFSRCAMAGIRVCHKNFYFFF